MTTVDDLRKHLFDQPWFKPWHDRERETAASIQAALDAAKSHTIENSKLLDALELQEGDKRFFCNKGCCLAPAVRICIWKFDGEPGGYGPVCTQCGAPETLYEFAWAPAMREAIALLVERGEDIWWYEK